MTPRRRRGRVSEVPPPAYTSRPATRLLLDSHIFIWWASGDARFRPAFRAAIASARDVYLSVASAWEIAIKAQRRRLHVPADALLPAELERHGVTPLAITIDHALAAAALPAIHHDPFDRTLVAQAQLEGLTLVTSDPALARYGAPVLVTK